VVEIGESALQVSVKQLHGFIATQEPLNLLRPDADSTLIPVAERLGIAIVAYFPLASGLLTGKYTRGVPPTQGSRLHAWKRSGSSRLTERNFDTVERLERFASEHRHSLAELAIAWLLAKSYIPSVIAGATKPAQVEANERAATWKLTPDDLAAVERLAPA
jgi:aryl-alcohol dehydrogenase-like predicted oxidoreductase